MKFLILDPEVSRIFLVTTSRIFCIPLALLRRRVCLSVCLSVLLLCVYVFSLFVAFHVWALLPEIKLID